MFSDKNIQKIEEKFKVPDRVADKVKIVAEKVKGGYVIIDTRSPWDGSKAPWSRLSVAKIIFHQPSQKWKIYWQRASGRWMFYKEYKTFNNALKAIDEDKYCCFWG